MRFVQTLLLIAASVAGFLAITLWILRGPGPGPKRADFPKLVGEAKVTEANTERRDPRQLRVMVWNIHYGHANEVDHFAKLRPEDTAQTIEGIGKAIRDADVDMVMLQEVDLDADRSHNANQLRALAEASDMPYFAFVTTWNARYIPFPIEDPKRWLGRLHSGQAVLSRFPITRNHRMRLPQPAEKPFWYNAFYLNRAVQVAEIAVPGEPPIQLFNVHLEAFSKANRQRQARQMRDMIATEARSDGRFIVAGDFNAVAPESPTKKGYEDEPETDFSDDETINTIRRGLPTSDLLMRFKAKNRIFTFPAHKPTRQLDHLFAGRAWSKSYAWVQNTPETARLSDHLPLRAVLTGAPSKRLKGRAKPAAPTNSKPLPTKSRQAKESPAKELPAIGRAKGYETGPELGPEGLGVKLLAPERVDTKAPIQGAPPPPPKKLNPEGWLEGAKEIK